MNENEEAVVLQVLVGPHEATHSEEQSSIECTLDGVEGDRHWGRTKAAGVRERYASKGTEILNLRLVSLVSAEELSQIAQKMGVPEVTGEDLGANIVLQGIENLTEVPAGTLMRFSEQVLLFVTGENTPCKFPGRNIQKRYPDIPNLEREFPRAAVDIRGLVAIVVDPGTIRGNDIVEFIFK